MPKIKSPTANDVRNLFEILRNLRYRINRNKTIRLKVVADKDKHPNITARIIFVCGGSVAKDEEYVRFADSFNGASMLKARVLFWSIFLFFLIIT